ncbi:MAG: hypothetical protein PVG14_09910, partial [Anaerolineales bacterium]
MTSQALDASSLLLRVRKHLPRAIAYTLCTVFAIFFIFPFLWMVLGSFKPDWDILTIPPKLFPQEWTGANYPSLFARIPLLRMYFNSFFVTAVLVFFQT